MTTYYINADTGNDTTGDGSASNPWLTISHAKDNVVTGDTIFCQNSTATYLFEKLSFDNEITIQGESVGGVVFSTVSDIDEGWALNGDNYYTIKNITFSDINVVKPSDHSSVIYVGVPSGTLDISTCIFKDITITAGSFNWASGVLNKLYRYGKYIVSGCIFYNITNRGIIVRKVDNNPDFYTRIYFNNCLFNMNTVENTDILVGQNNPVTSFKNCIVYNDTGNGKSIAAYNNQLDTNTTFDYNCVYGAFSNPITGTGNLLDTDPLFIDPATNNYNLSPSSPCIDAGTLI